MRNGKFVCTVAVVLSVAATAMAETATIKGTVGFKGTPPTPRTINFGAEKQCAELHGEKMPTYEDVVVNKNGTLKWTFVYVKEGITGEFQPPAKPVVIDQKDCVFLPRISGMMVNQPVEVHNSDPVLHNVRTESKKGQNFNIAQPIQGMKTTRKFKTEEIGIPIKCDVHFWMLGFVHILSHPFFAVTGEDGSFTISGLPAGTYTIEAWHEKYGAQTQQVTVADGGTSTADFTFEPK